MRMMGISEKFEKWHVSVMLQSMYVRVEFGVCRVCGCLAISTSKVRFLEKFQKTYFFHAFSAKVGKEFQKKKSYSIVL